MRTLLLTAALIIGLAATAQAEIRVGGYSRGPVYVNGYLRQNGTYVQPHFRSYPDAYQFNNYGYRGYGYPSYGYGYGGGFYQPSYQPASPYFIPSRAYGAW